MPGKRLNLLPRLGGTLMLAAAAPPAAIGLALWLAAIPFGAARGFHHQARWKAYVAKSLDLSGSALMFPAVIAIMPWIDPPGRVEWVNPKKRGRQEKTRPSKPTTN